MSHMMIVQSVLRDRDAIQTACARLGWSLEEQAFPQLWGKKNGPLCAYVLTPNDHARSLGFQCQADGSYTVVYDAMDQRFLNRFMQEYNYAVIEAEASLLGYQLSSETLADGTISLTLEIG